LYEYTTQRYIEGVISSFVNFILSFFRITGNEETNNKRFNELLSDRREAGTRPTIDNLIIESEYKYIELTLKKFELQEDEIAGRFCPPFGKDCVAKRERDANILRQNIDQFKSAYQNYTITKNPNGIFSFTRNSSSPSTQQHPIDSKITVDLLQEFYELYYELNNIDIKRKILQFLPKMQQLVLSIQQKSRALRNLSANSNRRMQFEKKKIMHELSDRIFELNQKIGDFNSMISLEDFIAIGLSEDFYKAISDLSITKEEFLDPENDKIALFLVIFYKIIGQIIGQDTQESTRADRDEQKKIAKKIVEKIESLRQEYQTHFEKFQKINHSPQVKKPAETWFLFLDNLDDIFKKFKNNEDDVTDGFKKSLFYQNKDSNKDFIADYCYDEAVLYIHHGESDTSNPLKFVKTTAKYAPFNTAKYAPFNNNDYLASSLFKDFTENNASNFKKPSDLENITSLKSALELHKSKIVVMICYRQLLLKLVQQLLREASTNLRGKVKLPEYETRIPIKKKDGTYTYTYNKDLLKPMQDIEHLRKFELAYKVNRDLRLLNDMLRRLAENYKTLSEVVLMACKEYLSSSTVITPEKKTQGKAKIDEQVKLHYAYTLKSQKDGQDQQFENSLMEKSKPSDTPSDTPNDSSLLYNAAILIGCLITGGIPYFVYNAYRSHKVSQKARIGLTDKQNFGLFPMTANPFYGVQIGQVLPSVGYSVLGKKNSAVHVYSEPNNAMRYHMQGDGTYAVPMDPGNGGGSHIQQSRFYSVPFESNHGQGDAMVYQPRFGDKPIVYENPGHSQVVYMDPAPTPNS